MPCHPRFAVRQAGFTIVELLIGIVVVGVLTAIALPNYLDSMRKGRRSDAVAALSAVQQAQERWRANNASYAQSVTNDASGTPAGLSLPAASAHGYYSISLSDVSATGYRAVATATSGSSQAADGNCAQLSVRMDKGNLFYGSTASGGSFDETPGNRCWAR